MGAAPGQSRLDLTKSQRPLTFEIAQDQEGPASANNIEGARERTNLAIVLSHARSVYSSDSCQASRYRLTSDFTIYSHGGERGETRVAWPDQVSGSAFAERRSIDDGIGSPPRRGAGNALLQAPLLPTLLRMALPNLAALLVAAAVAIAETSYVGILARRRWPPSRWFSR